LKKVLIITYYWPPSGGAGVQRWLKLSKYLTKLGVDCHVLTVDEKESSYNTRDFSLQEDISKDIKVYKTKSFEITNYYAKLFGKDKVPVAGFSNVNNDKLSQKIINSIRSNFFIPDPRVGWNRFALKKATEIIKEFSIKNIITTSPPHSTQLIGYRLKKKFSDINWISDFRDPWTDIYYYKLLNHSFFSHSINKSYEKKVLEKCDQIVTVSNGFAEIFRSKGYNLKSQHIAVIPNGFDDEDFKSIRKRDFNTKKLNITYTGTVSQQYNINILIDVIAELNDKKIELNFIGITDDEILKYAESKGVVINSIGPVQHNEVNQYQLDADVLLLFIPDIKRATGIVPGKLFEYLATKNPILGIGPTNGDAARFIKDADAGKMYERHERSEIMTFLKSTLRARETGRLLYNFKKVDKYSRKQLSREYEKYII